MSRIHEALKKAAQERMAQPGHPPVSDVIDLATGGTAAQTTSDNREDLRVQPAFTTAGDMWGSKFEDFARRCVRPSWKLESRSSIFSGDKGARVISERFRTLRSRLYQIAEIQPLRSLLITSSAGGGQDLHRQQPGAVHCPTIRPSRPADRRGPAGFAAARPIGGTGEAGPGRLSSGRGK